MITLVLDMPLFDIAIDIYVVHLRLVSCSAHLNSAFTLDPSNFPDGPFHVSQYSTYVRRCKSVAYSHNRNRITHAVVSCS